jgi:hypothetical protein
MVSEKCIYETEKEKCLSIVHGILVAITWTRQGQLCIKGRTDGMEFVVQITPRKEFGLRKTSIIPPRTRDAYPHKRKELEMLWRRVEPFGRGVTSSSPQQSKRNGKHRNNCSSCTIWLLRCASLRDKYSKNTITLATKIRYASLRR